MCDLALPDYTSRIVDVGIQQGGIENATPKAITESELNKILLFMTDSEQETVLNEYRLLNRDDLSDSEYEKYVKDHPALENEPIYVLNTKEEDTIEQLSSILAKPILLTGFLEQDNEQTAQIKEQLVSQMMPGAGQGIDAQQIDLFTLFSKLPKEQMEQITSNMMESFETMSDSMIQQSAAAFLKTEYERLGMDASDIQTSYILRTGLKMLGVSLLAVVATILVGFLASRVAASLGRDLRSRVFKKVVSFSNQEMDEFSTASLITRSTNDIQQIQMLMVMLLRIVFYAPILGIGGVIKVLGTNTSMTWIIAVGVAAVLTLVIVLFSISMPRFKMMQKLVDKLNLVTREILTGLPVIRAFSTEKYEENRFDKANQDLTKTNLFVNRVMTCMMPTMMLMMNVISIAIVWFGAKGVDAGQMQVGDMMAFLQYTMQIIMSFLMISIVSIMLPRASVSANRIVEVLKKQPAITDPVSPKETDPSKKGVVEFENVSFRYPNAEEDVLSNISFTAYPGQTTAFIGSTGSGKSTFTNRLKDEFKDQVAVLYHDNYYRAQDDIPFEERKKVNYDHPDAFETELLIEHIKQLKEGHAIQCPVYDYAAHNRSKEVVEIQPKRVILLEGILVLADPRLRELLDIKVFVEADADERILRRVIRDVKERGRDLEGVVDQYLTTVKPMHEQFVEPSKRKADLIVPRAARTQWRWSCLSNG